MGKEKKNSLLCIKTENLERKLNCDLCKKGFIREKKIYIIILRK